MNNGCGILYLAFGEEFDKLTAASARYSRKFTDLPICVLTNLKETNQVWKSVQNVCFKFVDLPSEKNRRVKVSLLDYSPYDETIFMDSDAVVQKVGIESLFDLLEDFDLVCQYYGRVYYDSSLNNWAVETQGRKSHLTSNFCKKTYDKLAKILGEKYPIELFGEAAVIFKKSSFSEKFFALWRKYWQIMGEGRDMPAFCFAVKHFGSKVKALRDEEVKFCTNVENEGFFIQHKGFRGFEDKFGLPRYKDWNPKL